MKVIIQYVLFLFFALNCITCIHAQTKRVDSLKLELNKSPKDSELVYLYTAIADGLYAYDTAKAMEYQQKGLSLARKMNWNYAIADNFQVIAMSRQFAGENVLAHQLFDSAIFYFDKTIASNRPAAEIENAKLSKATSLGQKADILMKRGRSGEAIAVYLATLETWRASQDPRKYEAITVYYTKISAIYNEMMQYEEALHYDKLALNTLLTLNNEESTAWAYVYTVQDFINLQQIDSALFYLEKVKPIITQLNNHRLNVQYYNRLGKISSEQKDYHAAIKSFEKALSEAAIFNSKFQKLAQQKLLGISYSRLADYATARKYFLLALPAADTGKYMREKMEILQELAIVEEKTNHAAKAYNYLQQSMNLRDSINQENSKKAVAEIESKYQAAEKDKEIIQLNSDKKIQALAIKQKSTLNYFLIGSLAVLLFAGFLGFRNIRHRQRLSKQQDELQQQRISELEKDKQLVAVDSMLQGQEEERSRLAKDLHDGLGGLLSGVKFSLSNMKDNLIITPDNMAVFERSLDMIDTSIKELRRVAHNMMPEMLTKFGLDEALKEYSNTINSTGLLSLKYQSMGMDSRIEKTSEIIIYRIVQELLNNILKHSSATEAMVQLIKDNGRFSIMVEDNGKGFDTALTDNKGAGLTSIQSRVDYLKGKLDIHSEPGKGTLVNIEFNIQS